MAHMIEAAKSGRASCRTCKKAITKGELRLGEEVPNQFNQGETTYNWHHLPCAAQKKPAALTQALESTDLEVPDKDELLKSAAELGKSEKPTNFPYAEHAPTSRSTCLGCSEKIEKGELRLAIESEVDTGAFVRRGPGYLHPSCAIGHTGEDARELLEKVTANSLGLAPADLGILEEILTGES